ncbi:hypothetical protein [Nostoc sp. 106C]|uniref:hypothetical protein n=1 Tax=Nostoc sp. 106C TaxID=1932667 RepID=UPI0030D8D857
MESRLHGALFKRLNLEVGNHKAQKLIKHLQAVIPQQWNVIVACDRGLYADWLYELIVGVSWHPFLRINHQGQVQIPPCSTWRPLAEVINTPGQSCSARVVCFKTNPLECTLLARWDLGYKDPRLVLTDLEPNQADVLWYGLRPSTECVYRDLKGDGWQWHNTRLLSPQRAERLWLAFALGVGAAIALATLWMVMLGGEVVRSCRLASESNYRTRKGEAENQSPPPNYQQLPNKHIAFSKAFNPKPLRQISCFLLGFITLIADLLNGFSIHLHRWSSFPPTPVDAFYYSHLSSA